MFESLASGNSHLEIRKEVRIRAIICKLMQFIWKQPFKYEDIMNKTIDKEERRQQKDPSGVPTFNHFKEQEEGLEKT